MCSSDLGIFIKLGLKAAENKGWRIREAIKYGKGASDYIVKAFRYYSENNASENN